MSNTALQTFTSVLAVKSFDKDSERKARAIFESYKRAGVIYNCDFDDMVWYTTD